MTWTVLEIFLGENDSLQQKENKNFWAAPQTVGTLYAQQGVVDGNSCP